MNNFSYFEDNNDHNCKRHRPCEPWCDDRNPCINCPPGPQGPQGPQGEKGADGIVGKDGYSPVRGTDYWTPDDIAEIKSYVDEAILGGAW